MNTTTLTERDKKLLNFLAYIVIIFVFIWCIIRPLCNKIITTHEDILIASSQQNANMAKNMGISSARTLTESFNDDLSESVSQYYDYMDSSEIDKLVTSYILEKGLTARELTITMPTDYVDEKPYAYSEIAANLARIEEIEVAAAKAAEAEESTDTVVTSEDREDDGKIGHLKDAILAFVTGYDSEQISIVSNPTEEYVFALSDSYSTTSSGILCVPLTITMEGDDVTEQEVIDELTKNPSLRITGFRWGHLDPVTYLLEDGTIIIIENEATQLSVSVNLYMKDKTEGQ